LPSYKLVLEYDGTRYSGWQIQPSVPTIQGELLARLRRLFDEPDLLVAGAARTDAGTHARGQVASFSSSKTWDPARLRRALNRILPDDISVAEAAIVPDTFHARRSATGRIYVYTIATGDHIPPFIAPFVHAYHGSLDDSAMALAARHLLGEHDFSSFRAAGDVSASSVKTIRRSEIDRQGDGITYTVEGSSFLQHMVRTIAGTLLEVGRGARPASWVKEVVEARSRKAAGPTLPAKGLVLDKVLYPPPEP